MSDIRDDKTQYAFPFEIPAGGGCGPITHFGMTLRDYFAAKAMQGWWASPNEALPDGVTFEENQRRMCEKFYEWADVMLSARVK